MTNMGRGSKVAGPPLYHCVRRSLQCPVGRRMAHNVGMLNVHDHRRDSAGLTYIYPVVSRRAGGVSVGVNLNINNACNWACVYCQVPGLTRGGPPPVDLVRLEAELRGFLHNALHGDYLTTQVPETSRRLVDVAFSGNGEPTSAAEFPDAVSCVERVLREYGLLETVKVRLITNGSLLHRARVRQGVERIGAVDGEVWFKIDRANVAGVVRVNGVRRAPERVRAALLACAERATTWVQTCYFAIDGRGPEAAEQAMYLELIASVRDKIKGVHLYGLARPSLQAEAWRLSDVPAAEFQGFAQRIAALGVAVTANP